MNRYLSLIAFGTLSCSAFATDVGVSVTVSQPGLYGRIDIGNVQPQVINNHPTPGNGAPVYMHVPPGHAKHWSKHCAEYNACGQRVYFVNDEWYNNVYVQQRSGAGDNGGDRENGRGHGRGREHGHGNGRGQDD